MLYLIGGLIVVYNVFLTDYILKMTKKINRMQLELDKLADLTGNYNLKTFVITDEMIEKLKYYKAHGNITDAVCLLEEETGMPRDNAIKYVDKLSCEEAYTQD